MSQNRSSFFVLVAVLVLTSTVLACGSSVQVNTPTSESASGGGETSGGASAPTEAMEQPTATAKALGSARSAPAPVGSEVVVDEMAISVQDVVNPADDIIAKGNSFNSDAEAGNHYIFADLSVTCEKTSDESCNLSGYEFSVINSSGVTHDPEIFVAGVDGMFEGGEFYGGATKTGYLTFIVPDDDTGLIMKYSAILSDEAFLSLQ